MMPKIIPDRWLATVRKIHRTTGIVAAPLIVIIGLSGLFLNHGNAFETFFSFDRRHLETIAEPWTREQAAERAVKILGGAVKEIEKRRKEHRLYFRAIDKTLKRPGLIIETASHSYWLVRRYNKVHYDDNGERIERRWFLKRLAKDLHGGRILGLFGKLMIDLLSLCLVVFAITGTLMWVATRRRSA